MCTFLTIWFCNRQFQNKTCVSPEKTTVVVETLKIHFVLYYDEFEKQKKNQHQVLAVSIKFDMPVKTLQSDVHFDAVRLTFL